MKKLLFVLLLLVVGFASCTQSEKQPPTRYNYTLAIRYIDNTLDTVVVQTDSQYGLLFIKVAEPGFFSDSPITPTLFYNPCGISGCLDVSLASSVKRFTIIKIDTTK